ncbi:MAG: hypothetical protein A2020_06990 [Lentisphaerae bacterium GWF2_45_14]|nr:MAG: hypothetical protein A2020_06990 [Lentisphaerae bacterium GWF2_45_14]
MGIKNYLKLLICLSPGATSLFAEGANEINVKLLVPEVIYAVPDIETNVYYDNIVTTVNSANYVFEVKCKKGRNDEKRWRFTPKPEDVGEHPWVLNVIDSSGKIVDYAKSKIIVCPANAGEGKKLTVLMMGASQTAASVYPAHICGLMSKKGNPVFRTIGSRGTKNFPELRHEGWGGWGWDSFFTRYNLAESDKNDGLHPQRPQEANSRFIFEENGKPVFDFKKYCEKYNDGASPDAVTILLGINNVFFGTDDTMEDIMKKKVYPYLEEMISEFRRVSPNVIIGVGLLPPPASSQDAFGANYGCQQTRWQVRKNLDHFNRALISKAKVLGFDIIPFHINLDTENGFPTREEAVNVDSSQKIARQSNAFHPAQSGYQQMGDTVYAWLKYQLHKGGLKP